MSKIVSIEVSNLKGVEFQSLNLNGASVIVTGRNKAGKSTLLRSIIDRIKGESPTRIVKDGTKKGHAFMELSSGERFEWLFDDEGKDKLVYMPKKDVKVPVTKAIGSQFFPESFDIDAFLKSPPKKAGETLQKLVGIDFTTLDKEYDTAYKNRTAANNTYATLKARVGVAPEKVDAVEVSELLEKKEKIKTDLNQEYLRRKNSNSLLRQQYDADILNANNEYNQASRKMQDEETAYSKAVSVLNILKEMGYPGKEVQEWIDSLPRTLEVMRREVTLPTYEEELPDDSALVEVDKELVSAADTNMKAERYNNYLNLVVELETAEKAAKDADFEVKSVENRRKELIASAKLPEGISFTEAGTITVNGFPLDDEQISTSEKYITALKLGSMQLGHVDSMYFDASTLDRKSYEAVQAWADEQGLQLLAEKASWDDEDLKYEIIETK